MRSTHFEEGDQHHSSESHVRVKVAKTPSASNAKRAKNGRKTAAKRR